MAASLRGREPGSRGTSTGEDTADWEDLVRAVMYCRLCELLIAQIMAHERSWRATVGLRQAYAALPET
jgi:hypothetical protein